VSEVTLYESGRVGRGEHAVDVIVCTGRENWTNGSNVKPMAPTSAESSHLGSCGRPMPSESTGPPYV
jgi:hypothetical protein